MRLSTPARLLAALAVGAGLALAASGSMTAQQAPPAAKAPVHARQVKRLLIRNAMVIYGTARPAFGPTDVAVEDGLILRVGGVAKDWVPDAVIDATGKYVMPGIVNTHIHLHDERGGKPEPYQYELNLYLAAGATTIRDVGSDWEKAKKLRADSAAHTLVAPRILLYETLWRAKGGNTEQQIREGVRFAKEQGVDGLKMFQMDRDQLATVLDEAKKVGLRTAIHIAVDEINARHFAEGGGTSIEHFYGVPDAAFDGIQDFPPEHNASNEVHRFGRAGELFIQQTLNRKKLSEVLALMANKGVFWCPTLSIYEASRDVIRAQNLPWYKEYLHPTMEDYFKPDMKNHGSYFLGWTSTQEIRWRRSYQVWMDALREFANLGGTITVGDDAGFIYSLYGFGQSRELELLEEAGFHPLEVIRMATVNGAELVGMGDRLGRVRQGFIADLLVVNGNPLENLRLLNPAGADVLTYDGKVVNNYSAIAPGDPKAKVVRGGGIEWTIKDGIPYHVPTLMKEVKGMVDQARAERAKKQ